MNQNKNKSAKYVLKTHAVLQMLFNVLAWYIKKKEEEKSTHKLSSLCAGFWWQICSKIQSIFLSHGPYNKFHFSLVCCILELSFFTNVQTDKLTTVGFGAKVDTDLQLWYKGYIPSFTIMSGFGFELCSCTDIIPKMLFLDSWKYFVYEKEKK